MSDSSTPDKAVFDLEAAQQRSEESAGLNIAPVGDIPIAHDTANLRFGPNLHDGLLALLPLVGVWEGEGEYVPPTGDPLVFKQQLVVSHDGENYLSWSTRMWQEHADGSATALPQLRESGFWRIGEDDTIELLITQASGMIELYYGEPVSQTAWELATDVAIKTATGPSLGGAKRLVGLVENSDLAYVEERMNPAGELKPRISTRLGRVMG